MYIKFRLSFLKLLLFSPYKLLSKADKSVFKAIWTFLFGVWFLLLFWLFRFADLALGVLDFVGWFIFNVEASYLYNYYLKLNYLEYLF